MDFKALGAAIMAAIQHAADGELEQEHLDAIDTHLAADDANFATKADLAELAAKIPSNSAPADTSGFASAADLSALEDRVKTVENDLDDLAGGAATGDSPGAAPQPQPAPLPVHITIGPAALTDGTVAAPYTGSLSADGGTSPYTYAVIDGALPDGISLAPSGTLSGTPVNPGSANFAVQATDSSSPPVVASASFSLNVAAQGG